MKIIQAIMLGLLQGLTEFLPVSSSGHLILFKHLFKVDAEKFGLTFDIAVHVATLAAVFIVFRKDIFGLIKKPFQKLTFLLIVATIPAAVAGLLFEDKIEEICASGGLLGIAFLITALILFLSERISKSNKYTEDITYTDALSIGLMQAVAITPGISRSGSTLSMGLMRGLKKETALKFSFLMSIPVILGSAVIGAKNIIEQPESFDALVILAGMLSAGISGYIAIKFMLDFFKKRSLKVFAIYVGILGVLVIADQLFIKEFFKVFLF